MAVIDRTPVGDRPNRVHWFAGRVHEVLDDVTAGGVCAASLSAAETSEALTELTRASRRIDALRLALLTHGEVVEVATEAGATSTGAWLAHATRTVHGEAFALVKLANRLDAAAFGPGTDHAGWDHDFAATRDAALAGHVDVDQARVVVEAVDRLPGFVDASDRERAEKHLLAEAAHHDAKRLRRLARHLLHVIDPDAADQELAKQLQLEEAEAARKTMLTMVDDGQGTVHGKFRLPSVHGAMLAAALHALASPRRPDAIAREETDAEGRSLRRASPQVLGEAFCQLLERFPTGNLPQAGGGLLTVVATIPVNLLESGLGLATLDNGGQLSAGQLRRLACSAGIIPAVLGSGSRVLDLGRRARFATPAQRIALAVRQSTCTAEGCDIPAAWCDAHHDRPWSQGGRTDLDDLRLLCPRHHRLVHRPDSALTDLPGGRIQITNRRRH